MYNSARETMDLLSFAFSIGFCHFFCFIEFSAAIDAITQNQSITKATSLVSKHGSFELGFFTPNESSKDLFLGIWHKTKIPLRTVVWVANQHNPIKNSSGVLKINDTGNAILLGQNNSVVWSTNSSLKQVQNPVLQLLDSGNLVLKDGNNYLWQSFEDQMKSVVISDSTDQCGDSGYCGPNGMCDISKSPVCSCPKGFKPKSAATLKTFDYREGCVRNEELECGKTDYGFTEYGGVKLPDGKNSWADQKMSPKECEEKCLKNCSCMAYASSDANGGVGCTIWLSDLVGIRDGGQNLFVKMPSSEIDEKHGNKVKIVAITIASSVFIIIGNIENNGNEEAQNEDLDLPLFNLPTITTATDNFSFNNKLGQGGFGAVYRGTLEDGQEIAVKRLSQSSGQGANEFKNEVILIAKLQHRNLVRLLGCCIHGEERLLIYEYMANKNETRGKVLDWPKRFNIVLGIVRGLIYLHQDSRLRIIHRDLKASNVLLDGEMIPKISDFGMARTFGGDQTEGLTNRVVGTFGYMAPEYAIDGQFSVKSDVFSFGILMLEIVSGKRNRGFYNPSDDDMNLIGYAWELWKEGRPLGLLDECLTGDTCTLSEAQRCIHVGLLCVQQLPEDRPSISYVLLMLGDDRTLPQPKEPSFFLGKKSSSEAETSSSTRQGTSSTNDYTISLLYAR
ncbi:G-type lectin S-receptor-like serine/threonine-protein kinase SD1-1 [Morus notabilis]|uniref:non-specific serine/threonine protein kinase n=1 Tax=Morus notabilis TaxID=981085 RepID=W9RS35_9ROSA|nr:G-type lectin S-receptor-like serine/threonine-protein kinase SD1-1 [Morus notabilis]